MAAIIRLPFSINNPSLPNISDLPFQKGDLSFWVNGNGVQERDEGGYLDALVDRNNGAVYPFVDGRLFYMRTEKGVNTLVSRALIDGQASNQRYEVNDPALTTAPVISLFALVKWGSYDDTNLSTLFRVSVDGVTLISFRRNLGQELVELVCRRKAGDGADIVSRPSSDESREEYQAVSARLDFSNNLISLRIGDQESRKSMSTFTGMPIGPLANGEISIGATSSTFGGTIADLIVFKGEIADSVRADVMKHLGSKLSRLSA